MVKDGDDRLIRQLVASMSPVEKVGQLNQRLLGWKSLDKVNGRLVVTDYLKREIDNWGGLGLLYGLFRADPWSGRSWQNGIRPEERPEAMALVQDTVIQRGNRRIAALMVEEAPHGHQALGGSILPANLALAASFDPELVRRAQEAVARQLSASGVHIALVSGLDIAIDPRWGRCEECFGEDPRLSALMCQASVLGMQGENRQALGHGGVAVVMKHLAAQGAALGGRNGQSASLGPHDLRQIHLQGVQAAVEAGVCGLMAAYNDIDGVPCCANPWLLQTYLRDELGFKGIVMADGLAVDRLVPMTGSVSAAGRAALLAGVDVSLWDDGFTTLAETLLEDPEVSQAVDRSLHRVLSLKQTFGLLPEPASNPAVTCERIHLTSTDSNDSKRSTSPQCAESTPYCGDTGTILAAIEQGNGLSKQCAQAALVELGGGSNLDVETAGPGAVLVTGPLADDVACFLGDYTAPLSSNLCCSLYQSLSQAVSAHRKVVLWARPYEDIPVDLLTDLAMIIHVSGGTSERAYQEEFAANGAADDAANSRATGGEGVDLACIDLPWQPEDSLSQLRAMTTAPIIGVVVAGRAHVLTDLAQSCDRLIWAGYPGPYGPWALTQVILGKEQPHGRLPMTLPSASGVVPVHYNDRQPAAEVYKDVPNPVFAPFARGQGLVKPQVESLVIDSPTPLTLESVRPGMQVHIRVKGAPGEPIVVHANCRCDQGVSPGPTNLFIHRSRGTVVPRMIEFADTAMVPQTVKPAYVVSWQVPYSMIFDRKEGTSVELFDDDQDSYCLMTWG